MKKTKGTGVMLFGMFAIIVIIAVFILAGNGAKKGGGVQGNTCGTSSLQGG